MLVLDMTVLSLARRVMARDRTSPWGRTNSCSLRRCQTTNDETVRTALLTDKKDVKRCSYQQQRKCSNDVGLMSQEAHLSILFVRIETRLD